MRRSSSLLSVVIGLGLVLASCASPASSTRESTAGSTPTTESNEPEESQGGGEEESPSQGSGGGSTGEAPALADGSWTSGHAQITVGGGVSLSIDQDLTTDLSETTDAKTQLAYNTEAEFVTIDINFTGVPFLADVTGNDWSASSQNCEVTYDQADDTAISGSFNCVADEFYWFAVGEEPTDPVTLEGSFTAGR